MIEVSDPESLPEVADWVELSVCVSRSSLSKAEVASAIEGTAGREPSEGFITSVWRELERRERLYLRSFFHVEARLVEPGDGCELPEYLACLLLSLYGAQESAHTPAKLFERLSREAISSYLCGQAVVFGWPADLGAGPNELEQSQIERRIRKVAEDLGERFSEPPPPRFNDRGLDVVGWIPFVDRRPSQIVVLMQSTIQRNWKDKLAVPLRAWCEYIHWGCAPVTAFAIPRIVADYDWHETSSDKGMLFDRIRIVNLLLGGARDTSFREELTAWVERRLSDLD